MPYWLIIALIVFLAAPGVIIVLYGVFALFMAPEPALSPAEEQPAPTEPRQPLISALASPDSPPITAPDATALIDDEVIIDADVVGPPMIEGPVTNDATSSDST